MTSEPIDAGIAELSPMSEANRAAVVTRAARIIADQRGTPKTDDLTWWATAALTYEHMLRDWERSFELYHSSIIRGQKLWRDEKPAERELIGPDTGKLIAWLLALVERAEYNTPLPFDQRVMIDDFPRRNRVDHFTPAERAIWDAVGVVERVGAHPWLTDAVVLLSKARDRVADYVDSDYPDAVTQLSELRRNDSKENADG